MKFPPIFRRIALAFTLCSAAHAHAAKLADYLLNAEQAISTLRSLHCESPTPTTRMDCRYGALAESAAMFDACLPLLEKSHHRELSKAETIQYYAPLSAWTSMAPLAARIEVLNPGNNLRKALAEMAAERLSNLSGPDLDRACSATFDAVQGQADPLALTRLLWSPKPEIEFER